VSFSPALFGYGIATTLLASFAGIWLNVRARSGKEDAERLGERFGRYSQQRPRGALVWLHAASVGESGVALQIIDALAARDAALSFLLSTGTRTSADLVKRRANARTTHVYAPLDTHGAVHRFLAHWRPDLGVFVESELWPNLILGAERAGVPLAFVNARMSPSSLRRWMTWRAAGRTLARAFGYVSAADARTAQALSFLRDEIVAAPGNLKLAAPAPPIDAEAREALAKEIGARPVWLAASTHAGEDEVFIAAHAKLRTKRPDALLIIAPRHPERGADVAARAGGVPRRSRFEPIGSAPIYVADTLGEMGLLYSLTPVAFVAGSLLPHLKGHNPIEPAKLDTAVMTGPHFESFEDIFTALFDVGGTLILRTADEIVTSVEALWSSEFVHRRMCEAARRVVDKGAHALDGTSTALLDLLKRGAHASA
jgi:3-deoxy-D-manno-octulosonic-acid transferase